MLEKLKGRFWTSEEEMIAEIEAKTDYDVLDIFEDKLNIIDRTGDDGEEIEVKFINAGKTIALDLR